MIKRKDTVMVNYILLGGIGALLGGTTGLFLGLFVCWWLRQGAMSL